MVQKQRLIVLQEEHDCAGTASFVRVARESLLSDFPTTLQVGFHSVTNNLGAGVGCVMNASYTNKKIAVIQEPSAATTDGVPPQESTIVQELNGFRRMDTPKVARAPMHAALIQTVWLVPFAFCKPNVSCTPVHVYSRTPVPPYSRTPVLSP